MPPVNLIERKTYHCLYCDTKFKSGDWFGCGNNRFRKHKVEPKSYHSTHDNHIICITKETKSADPVTGQALTIPGFQAQFVNGHFTTDDAEYQERLDHIMSEGSLVTMDQYVNSKLTDRQRSHRAQGQLAETSELLANTQAELARVKAENERMKSTEGVSEEHETTAGAIPGNGGLPGQRSKRA